LKVVLVVLAFAAFASASSDHVECTTPDCLQKEAKWEKVPEISVGYDHHLHEFAKTVQQHPMKVVKQINDNAAVDKYLGHMGHMADEEATSSSAPAPVATKTIKHETVTVTPVPPVLMPAPPTPVESPAMLVPTPAPAAVPVVDPVVHQHTVVVNKFVPAPAPPAQKVIYEYKPVPVPVPVVVKRDEHEHCGIKVSQCFAKNFEVSAPSFTGPVMEFSGSYRNMCAPEIKVKKAAVEKKQKEEIKNKELCKKSEINQKFAEKKVKLMVKKEKFSKAVGEGKEKYLEKKIKSAEENAVKVAGQTMEFTKKTTERQNKKEDELYTKECTSKENAFKTVREGKQKVKVVYVKSIPVSVPAPAPVLHPVVNKQKVIVNKIPIAPAPAKVVTHKKIIVLPTKVKSSPAPAPKPVSSLKEVLIKNGEITKKSELKSQEMIEKSVMNGKEQVHKEQAHKKHHVVIVKPNNEGACKEKESKESVRKAEIEQKLAVEKVRKEAAVKESQAKSKVVVKPKKCNPITSLEKYVKKCKAHEESFAKAKVENEKKIKEVKQKSKEDQVEITCELSRGVCKKIFSVSQLNDKAVNKIVQEHTAKFEAAIEAAKKLNTEAEDKMKYDICESAAADVKYFVRNYLPKFTL